LAYLLIGQPVGGPRRVDARLEQHLISDPVTHARHDLVLIEQQRLDSQP
jgi:hypothetical protein